MTGQQSHDSKRFFLRCCLIGLSVALVFAACSRRRESTVGTPGNPLIVLLSPAHAPTKSMEPIRFIEEHLRSRTGLTIEVHVASSPVDAIEQFGGDIADVGILTLDEYLLAREEYGIHADLQAVRHDSATEYAGVILVRADNGIKDVRALAGKKVAFADPYSVSGFLLQAAFLRKAGVKVDPFFAGSHDAALRALADGRVLAAATYADALSLRPELRLLVETGEVPNEPVVIRRGLRPPQRQAVVSAFLTLGDTPEGKRALQAIADITRFRRVSEDAYRPTHDLIRSMDKSVYDLIPEGWDIRRLNRPYLPD
jgi:phosphonate transport system substrate-binding protein